MRPVSKSKIGPRRYFLPGSSLYGQEEMSQPYRFDTGSRPLMTGEDRTGQNASEAVAWHLRVPSGARFVHGISRPYRSRGNFPNGERADLLRVVPRLRAFQRFSKDEPHFPGQDSHRVANTVLEGPRRDR